MTLTFLYRGPLASCNYSCAYCPFAKRTDSRDDLARDESALERFVSWVVERPLETRVFFTPWGEALIRRHYQRALIRLSHALWVSRVAIQTNLSGSLDFLDDCRRERLGLWCTFHPSEVSFERFVARCRELEARGVPHSVGIVGKPEHLGLAERLRRVLPAHVYVWVNADRRAVYDADSVARLVRVDPLFESNLRPPPSAGAPCATGETVLSVDGDGNLRRCHFIDEVIGNLYESGWERVLAPGLCPRSTCTCHIGYVHRQDLPLGERFGEGILERRLPVRRLHGSISGA